MRRIFLLVAVVACGGGGGGSNAGNGSGSAGGSLVVQTSGGRSLTIPAGGTVQLQALRRDTDAYGSSTLTPVAATWSSGNTAVATVDANGLVTGVSAGSAVITAQSGGASGQATVTVGAATASAVTIEWTQAAISSPVTTTVAAGTAVQWHAADATHDVIADGSPPPNPITVTFGSTSAPQTFANAGMYPYHCTIHPGMKGTVIVR